MTNTWQSKLRRFVSLSLVSAAFTSASLVALETAASAATPNAPGSVSASPAISSAVVSWTAPSPATGVTITGYTATASPGGQSCTVAAAAPSLSCTIPGLTPSTSYTFSVFASSTGGSGPSAVSSAVTTSSLSASTITLSASPLGPQNLNTRVTITATVTSGTSGTVNFKNGSTTIAGCGTEVVSSGFATCSTTSLPAGTNSLTGVYSGDASHSGSTSSTLSYVISSTTLTAAASPLIITSTVSVFNATLAMVTTGGNGSGAITYSVTNGTATGCSFSGSTLSVPTNVSGTCLVTATQASASTYLGDSSAVTAVNFFWNYATWPYSYYYCTSGDTLSGSTCTNTYAATATAIYGWWCDSGWSPPFGSSTCDRIAYISQASCTANGGTWLGSSCELFTSGNYGTDGGAFGYIYSCTSGDTLSGTNCLHTYGAFTAGAYSCPYGGTLSGMTCSLAGGSGPNLRQRTGALVHRSAALAKHPPGASPVSAPLLSSLRKIRTQQNGGRS